METKIIAPFVFGDHLLRAFEDKNGNPWFVAKDVCRILEIQNNRDALSALDEDEIADVGISDISSNGVVQRRNYSTISESGLYALVFRSRKPEAKIFSKWVRSEVLPALRKNGHYEMPTEKKTGSATNISYNFPHHLLEISSDLKPAMRQRLWRDALDTVRLDGGGFEAACECFTSMCAMMVAKRKFPDLASLILQFMNDCLEESQGFNTPSYRIYELFQAWWDENGSGTPPSRKILGGYMQSRFESFKSSVVVYRDCRIRYCTV